MDTKHSNMTPVLSRIDQDLLLPPVVPRQIITLILSDGCGSEVYFKVWSDNRLDTIMKAYGQREGAKVKSFSIKRIGGSVDLEHYPGYLDHRVDAHFLDMDHVTIRT